MKWDLSPAPTCSAPSDLGYDRQYSGKFQEDLLCADHKSHCRLFLKKSNTLTWLWRPSEHIHLLVRDGKEPEGVARTMQLIAGRTGQEYNQRKMRRGAFLEDRYRLRAKTFKSDIYSGNPEMPLQGPQVINLISINAEDLAFFSGVKFMYLWNP